ncbi:hypothetical protein GGTG_06658 [Gaeumannomyces tritici R3-111a-1]|uniref:Mannan endo-1,4-beta-mannosidase n=1 Tax=Gaeumannomyces tritici (strain R3-111a-1) TaxID=644352 RepID=J3NZF9_GAET3|nr:hypothetical protein GGTG_06658 [Gaeumannomyces tritici R3-111a-1]EJT76742.1 hypothetical protein GGTG_06658 [Gaeumannomyces tritici R3-111a-1]
MARLFELGTALVAAAFAITSASAMILAPRAAAVFEAEDAALTGTNVLMELKGFSGKGYVGGFDADGDKITFTVPSDDAKLYNLNIRYAGIYGEKRAMLRYNGGSDTEILLKATSAWETVSGGQVLLNKGENKIEILNNWGWFLIDYISIEATTPRGPHDVNAGLNNAKATTEAKALYSYLRSIYGKKILSGQQDLKWADYVTQQTGKTPALVAVDLMDYTPSRVEHGTKGAAVEEALAHHARGGIVSVLWHWNAPAGLYNTAEQPWYSGFYTRATDFDVSAAMADTANANYTLLVRDVDAIAVQLKKLRNAGVAVLWRPLHEAEGAWFWWGAKGPEPCKKLWAMVHDRLTNHHGLDNLIWVWNSALPEWYPGDETVDILSADVYAKGNGPMSLQYNELVTLGKDKKLIAAAEVGSVPKPELLKAYQAHWLWFCVWEDQYINNKDWNDPALLKAVYNDDYVLTLDKIQGWAKSGGAK